MSSRKLGVKLSPDAESDFVDILQYTEERWGLQQVEKYAAKLDKAITVISENPFIGRAKDIYFAGCRAYHVGRHFVLYRVKESTVEIVRIIPDDRDIKRHIPKRYLT